MTVRLETETGTALGEVLDLENTLTRLVANPGIDLVVAQMIDPYGNTVLNRLQVPLFLADLERLRQCAQPDPLVFRAIEELARRSLVEPHLYLKFYGD